MKNLIIIFLVGIFFTSCWTEQKCASKYPPQVITNTVIEYRDTIVKIIIHDTTFIKADTVYDTTEVFINNGIIWSNKVYGETDFASAWAQVVNSRLKLELIQKDSAIAKLIKENVKIVTKTVIETKTEIKKVFVTKWYDKFSRVIAILFISALVIMIVIKVIKMYIKPF